MMDRYLLRYFLAVVDHGNFSRGAAHCHVAQPTLSVGIAKLERELGTALFTRSNQRVRLTQSGTRFLGHARRIEAEFNLAEAAVGVSSDARPLRIGILQSVPMSVIASAAHASRATLAEQPIELIEGTERDLIGHLARGRLDVAVTLCARGSGLFLEQPVLQEGYRLAVPSDHRLAGKSEVAAESLIGETMIVRRHCEALGQTSRFFTDRGVRPHFALRSHNDINVLQMIAAGLGLTVIPASFACPGVLLMNLTGFAVERSVGLLFGHEAEHLLDASPPFLQAIVDRLRATSDAPEPSRGVKDRRAS